MSGDGKPKAPKGRARRRHAARLAAVQALYQIEHNDGDADVEGVILEFLHHRGGAVLQAPGEDEGDAAAADLDGTHFADLVRGTRRRQGDIDRWLGQALVSDWPLPRLDAVLRAILRCGTYELWARSDVPARVVISEYLDIAHAFFAGEESRMVNAVLDRIGRRLRESDLGSTPPGRGDGRNGTTG